MREREKVWKWNQIEGEGGRGREGWMDGAREMGERSEAREGLMEGQNKKEVDKKRGMDVGRQGAMEGERERERECASGKWRERETE